MNYLNFSTKSKKRVFLSFASEDLDHVRGLRLLKDNPNIDIEFFDESIKTPIESEDANYLKRKIREQISRASVTVCLISEVTHNSSWVNWELKTSEEEGNSIIAMAIKGVTSAILPKYIKDNSLTFWPWDISQLQKLIESANSK